MKMTATAMYGRAESQNLSIGSRLPLKVVFHRGSSPIEGRLPPKVILHWRWSSVKGRLLSKVIFCQRSSPITGHVPANIVCHQRSSFIEGCQLSFGGTRCALDSFNTNGYSWIFSDRRTGRMTKPLIGAWATTLSKTKLTLKLISGDLKHF